MRIGLVARRFDPAGGGTERDLIITARALTNAGHQVTIHAAEIRGLADGCEVYSVPIIGFGRALRLLSFGLRAARDARRHGVDLVLSFARVVDADLLRSGGSAHASYVAAARLWQKSSERIAMQLSPYHRVQIAIERQAFASSKLRRAIAVSNLVRADLIDQFKLAPDRCVTLYNGVDLDRFRPANRDRWRDAIRRELQIPTDAPVIAFVGNGFARKGLRFLMAAWPKVDSSARLIIAGADRAITNYRRFAERLGISNRVRFVGNQTPVEQVFAAADGVAMPSLFEPFGNVVLEAMAAGLPVACSSACGASELMPPSMRDLVVNRPDDVEELVLRLNTLISIGAERCAIARATAEHFTWARYENDLDQIVHGCV